MSKYITYIKADLIAQNENNVTNEGKIIFEYQGRNSDMDKCIILLPKIDITVKISVESAKKIELINLFDIYKFNCAEKFLLLLDYQIDDDNDIKLEFKNLSKIHLVLDDSFELFDLNNQYIGTALVIQV